MNNFRLFVFLLFALPFLGANAQSIIKTEVLFGFNAAQINGDNMRGFNKAGLNLGAATIFDFSNQFAGRIELTYSAKGSRRPNRDGDVVLEPYEIRVNFVEIPLLIEFKADDKFSFQGGVSVARLVSARLIDGSIDQDRTNDYFKFDYSYMVGLDYKLNEQWHVNGRYSRSIIPYNDFSPSFYNLVLNLTLRYRIQGK